MSMSVTHPSVAEEWHPIRNGILLPGDITYGSSKNVWWLCKQTCPHGCIHEWQTTVSNRCRLNYGCPYCSSLTKRVCIHTSIVGTHPEIAAQWHPTRNTDKRPEQFSYGSEKKVWWMCPQSCPHGCLHEWEADISKRILRGINAGCPFCASNHKKICIHDSIVTTHPHLLQEWHPEKNGTLIPAECIAGCNTFIWWKCQKGCEYGCTHEWRARISHRTQKNTGCPYCCKFRQQFCIHNSIMYSHPVIAAEWHPNKNGNLNPVDVISGSDKSHWWVCSKDKSHEWQTSINNRCLNGTGCPICTYKTENKVFNILSILYPDIKRQFTLKDCNNIRPLPFDFCIPSKHCIIEVDGDQHFCQVMNWLSADETLKRDVFKMHKASSAGYKVIRILQADAWKNSERWLYDYLVSEIESDARGHRYVALSQDVYARHITLYDSGAMNVSFMT